MERIRATLSTGDGCWLWLGKVNDKGYARIHYHGAKTYVHRLMYVWFVGPIPEGLELDHLCRNTRCCRPDHLEPVTHKVNLLRGVGACAIHARKTHCPKGHPLDGLNNFGSRFCRKCRKEYQHQWYLKKKTQQ